MQRTRPPRCLFRSQEKGKEMRASEILSPLGFPENPIAALKRLTNSFSGPKGLSRAKLVALEMLICDKEFAAHPKAWDAFTAQGLLPPGLLSNGPPVPRGWPVPVFLEKAALGGVAHVEFEKPGLTCQGHRLDLSGPMETLLKCFSDLGEKALPDSHLMPYAARVKPAIRLDERSWELPCLIAYFAEHSGQDGEPVFATAAVEPDGKLVPGRKLKEKLQGWIREVGSGGTAVVVEDQEGFLKGFESSFEVVVVKDLTDLARFLGERGWLAPHRKPLDRLGAERRLRVAHDWYRHGKPRLALLTLETLKSDLGILLTRQKTLWFGQMHHLLSCFGRFNEGLNCLNQMMEMLKATPEILTPDEEAIHMAKAAVQLYDAHFFEKAVQLLVPFVQNRARGRNISQISRGKVLGTLGQVFIALGRWEEGEGVLLEALKIFERMDPLEVSRAYHYLIHNRLRAGDLAQAHRLLQESRDWWENADLYGAMFRLFYETDLSRRKGTPCPCPQLPDGYNGLIHPYCFALQAWARNQNHALEKRIEAVGTAAQYLEEVQNQEGILGFLAVTYRLYQAHLTGNKEIFKSLLKDWRKWVTQIGGKPFRKWYNEFLVGRRPDGFSMEALLERIPYH